MNFSTVLSVYEFGFYVEGFKEILFLSGHYENLAFIREGAETAIQLTKSEGAKAVNLDLVGFGSRESAQTDSPRRLGRQVGVHASLAKTSLALSRNSDLVRTSQVLDDHPS